MSIGSSSIAEEAKRYLSLVDLTSLNLDDSETVITSLCKKAAEAPVPTAAVCVYPEWVKLAKSLLAGSGVSVATVINFPDGKLPAEDCLSAIKVAQVNGCDEIDFVIDWEAYHHSTNDAARDQHLSAYVRQMVAYAKPCLTKVILETSKLTPNEITSAARVAIAAGVDFLKTSTGKVEGGATVEAVTIFAREIKAAGRRVGIKPSGGIKSLDDCRALWQAATNILGVAGYDSKELFRFGASGVRTPLLAAIKGSEENSASKVQAPAGY